MRCGTSSGTVLGTAVVGTTVVGATVVGAIVVGATVVGAIVVGATGVVAGVVAAAVAPALSVSVDSPSSPHDDAINAMAATRPNPSDRFMFVPPLIGENKSVCLPHGVRTTLASRD